MILFKIKLNHLLGLQLLTQVPQLIISVRTQPPPGNHHPAPTTHLSSGVDLELSLLAALQLLWHLSGRHLGRLQGVYQLHIVQQRASRFIQQSGGLDVQVRMWTRADIHEKHSRYTVGHSLVLDNNKTWHLKDLCRTMLPSLASVINYKLAFLFTSGHITSSLQKGTVGVWIFAVKQNDEHVKLPSSTSGI